METISRYLLTFLAEFPVADSAGCRGGGAGLPLHAQRPGQPPACGVGGGARSSVLLPLASVRSPQPAATQFAASLADAGTANRRAAAACPGASRAFARAGIQNHLLAGTTARSCSAAIPVRSLPPRPSGVGIDPHGADPQPGAIRRNSRPSRSRVDPLPGGIRPDRRRPSGFRAGIRPGHGRARHHLPESLLAEPSEDVLTTAIGHEMAHIARRDFGCNLLYELLHVPIGFHPAAWLMRREIERTREMACDELVTHRLIDAGVYARSIVSIATGMMALPRPGYTLGVFDGDILEARIRRLVERPAANLKRARLLLATGLAALAVCAVIASSLALTARAQGGANAVMKQAEAAYNRGDYKGAAELFENAVRVEPANLKAKLLLANTLLREYMPGSGADNTLVSRARQQYLDVLAMEPGTSGPQGLMLLDTNTKQFAEAREWALKAIQADPTDKGAYYTIGFIDWATTYPDYAARGRLRA